MLRVGNEVNLKGRRVVGERTDGIRFGGTGWCSSR